MSAVEELVAECEAGELGWLSGVRRWALDEGRLRIGEPGRLLIVGQMPSRASDNALPFHGSTGGRLALLLGLQSRNQLWRVLDAWNSWPRYVEGAGGDTFPRARAAELCASVAVDATTCLLLGAAARAFGLRGDTPLFTPLNIPGRLGTTYYVAPHPSGRNRWWNSEGNRINAAQFYARLARACGIVTAGAPKLRGQEG